jgi:hypothetical protein
MDVSDARRREALEDENARLKKLSAEQMLDTGIGYELMNIESEMLIAVITGERAVLSDNILDRAFEASAPNRTR